MAHLHDFDPVSGWCSGCGLRDDGKLTDSSRGANGGRVLREAKPDCPALSETGTPCTAYAGPHTLHRAADGSTWRDWVGQRTGFTG